MKNTLLVIFIVVSFQTFSQDYTPLLDDEINEWHFTTCFFGCGTDVYYTDGDTLVNGKNYKILDGYHYINRNLLLREDVVEKKVFLTITQPQYVEDILLYDFSLAEGDTFEMRNPLTPFPAYDGFFVLDSIRMITHENGNELKHFYFTPAQDNPSNISKAEWVEGVGSLSMINAAGGEPNINQVGHLSCSFKDFEVLYSNLDSISSCDPVNLSLVEVNDSPFVMELFPLAERNHFLLTNSIDVSEVWVYGINGKRYKSITTSRQNELKLDLSDLKTGIYILKVKLHLQKPQTLKVVVR